MKALQDLIKKDFEWKVKSNSEKGKFYTVGFSEGMGWSCDCMAGSMRQTCRHIQNKQNEVNGKIYDTKDDSFNRGKSD